MTLLQTNSYIVPKDKRPEHARLMARFRRCFSRLGSGFEVYEQVGPNFAGDGGGRFVQIMRFRDRKHQQDVHERERGDAAAQTLIADFCRLVNLPYQQQQGLFATSFYSGVLHEPVGGDAGPEADADAAEPAHADEPHDAEPGQALGELVDHSDDEQSPEHEEEHHDGHADDEFDLMMNDDESDEVDLTTQR